MDFLRRHSKRRSKSKERGGRDATSLASPRNRLKKPEIVISNPKAPSNEEAKSTQVSLGEPNKHVPPAIPERSADAAAEPVSSALGVSTNIAGNKHVHTKITNDAENSRNISVLMADQTHLPSPKAESLWDIAYAQLCEADSDLVNKYTIVISCELHGKCKSCVPASVYV